MLLYIYHTSYGAGPYHKLQSSEYWLKVGETKSDNFCFYYDA